ncbi:MAG: PAS domain S-box protein, partial [Anaerolineae bacterium]|nr:PAS domain S-box protein [Anaerolineae bacterium]
MGRPLHVLILEDSEDDTQLLLLELRRIGYEVEFERVDTADAMQAVLTEKTWDVILSDYTMPRFSALQALEVLKASHLDLPFIIISGTIGEETAVAALKAGAHDFLIKGNFARLGSVIERELLEAETRRDRKRAEEALQTSEELFGGAFQHSPVGICITTLDGRLQNVSQSLADMLGFTTTELEGKRFNDITHPDDLEIGRDAVSRMISGRVPSVSFEKSYLHKTGEPVWALVSSSLLRDSSGQPVHLITHILNMTERKQAEAAVLEAEARYHRVLDAMMEGCQIIDFDWRYVYVNDVVANQGKHKREELLNHTMMEIYPGIENTELFASLRQCMEERTPKRMENQFVFPDGSIGWFELSIQPAREGIFILSTEITERKRSADQLNYHARLLRHINDAVIATDDQLRITAWNRAAEKMYGWSSKEVMGRNLSEILSFGLTEEQRAEARELLQESSASRSEGIHQRKDGRTIYVEANTIALIDEHGKMTGYVSVNRDITERKRAEEQTQLQLQRLKSLRAIDIAISSSFNLSLTLDILLDQVISQLNTDAAAVLLLDPIT